MKRALITGITGQDGSYLAELLLSNGYEKYPEGKPYPSCLIYGKTSEGRPLHIVCAHADDIDMVIIITVYQPREEKWVDFERRRQ